MELPDYESLGSMSVWLWNESTQSTCQAIFDQGEVEQIEEGHFKISFEVSLAEAGETVCHRYEEYYWLLIEIDQAAFVRLSPGSTAASTCSTVIAAIDSVSVFRSFQCGRTVEGGSMTMCVFP